MRAWIVVEGSHQFVALQRTLHSRPLNADATPVHESDLVQPGRMSFIDVLFHHRRDILGLKGMEVEFRFNRDADRLVQGQAPDSKMALTEVDSPPRTEKSPTIVMRFGLHAATRSSRIWFVTAS